MTEQESNSGAKPRVLVVDDSKLIRFSAKKILGEDYDVRIAEDGEAAWGMIGDDAGIQVVFTDLSMPVLDGFGLLERIRASDDERIAELPVIVVTSGEEESIRARAFELGGTDFITKPFDSVDLQARAKAHTRAVQQTQALKRQSLVCPVTGLRNAEFCLDQLARDASWAARHERDWSVVLVELARFRELFMKNGKAAAYSVLEAVAGILRDQVRREDTVARIGLAQFALSMPETDEAGATQLAERLRERIAGADFRLRSDAVGVVPSLAAVSPQPQRDEPRSILRQLAKATAAAEGKGGNRVVRLRRAPGRAAGGAG